MVGGAWRQGHSFWQCAYCCMNVHIVTVLTVGMSNTPDRALWEEMETLVTQGEMEALDYR